MEADILRDRSLAWNVANLTRARDFPSAKSYIDRGLKGRRQQTPEEQWSIIEHIHTVVTTRAQRREGADA